MDICLILNIDNSRNYDWYNNGSQFHDKRAWTILETEEETKLDKNRRIIINLKSMMITMEKTIINRCLEGFYRKNVGFTSPFFIGNMDNETWLVFCDHQNPDKIKKYHRKSPIHGGLYKQVFFQSLQWGGTRSGNWPILSTQAWYLHKWSFNGSVYRSIINSISITRNLESGLIRCKFQYDSNRYENEGWILC